MALFDVLNKKGEPTGTTKDSKQVFIDGDWHKASHMWIINSKSEVLISKRSQNVGFYKDFWTMSAGGHVDAGETGLECAVRETKEELGVTFKPSEFLYLFTVPFEADLPEKKVRQFNDIFLICSEKKISEYHFDKEEVSEIKFIHYKELEKLINNKKIEITPQFEQYKLLFEYLKKNHF